MNRARLALAGFAITVVGLSGCAAGHQPISEAEYLSTVRELASYSSMSDAELLSYGEEYCNFLTDHGEGTADGRRRAAETFLAVDEDEGGDPRETAIAVGTAVQRFCPEYRTD